MYTLQYYCVVIQYKIPDLFNILKYFFFIETNNTKKYTILNPVLEILICKTLLEY